MNYFDILFIIPLLWGAYKGYNKGFVIEIASFIALGLGIWGGVKFSYISAEYLSQLFDISEKLMPLISFAITFILIVIAVFTVAKLLQKVIKMVALGFVNRLAGLLFGCLKFALIVSVVINLVGVINEKIPFIDEEMKNSSLLYHPLTKVAQIFIPGLKDLHINTDEVAKTLLTN